MGMSSVWMVVSAPIGYALSFYLLGKRLRLLSELCDSVSLPDVVAARYNSEVCRLLTVLAILLGVMGYLGAQILAMATVLKDLIANHGPAGGLSLELCVAASTAVLVFDRVTGGIVASVYTDLVQGLMMVVVAILVFFTALGSFAGGMTGVVKTIAADNAEAVLPWGTLGIVGSLSWFFMFVIGRGSTTRGHQVHDVQAAGRPATDPGVLDRGLRIQCSAVGQHRAGDAGDAPAGPHPPLAIADQAAPRFLEAFAIRCWPGWCSQVCSQPSCRLPMRF